MMGQAAAGEVRAVVELFTSQGCSSCPPADRLLGELARDSSIVALTLPVDYWDYLGWKDTLASKWHSQRQRAYARVRGDGKVATPQAVVNGQKTVVGSDRPAIESAIAQAGDKVMRLPVSITAHGDALTISVPEAAGTASAEVWICALRKSVPVTIGRGENVGRDVTYYNVSRHWVKVGDWHGKAVKWSVPMSEIMSDIKAEGVDAAAAIVQSGSADKPGPMLGAALASIPSAH
jgi:hypothetical protein